MKKNREGTDVMMEIIGTISNIIKALWKVVCAFAPVAFAIVAFALLKNLHKSSTQKKKENAAAFKPDMPIDVKLPDADANKKEKEKKDACIEKIERYYDLEPEKSAAYRKAFLNERGIFDCMSHYRETVEKDLENMDDIEIMEAGRLLVKNILFYLDDAIKRMPKPPYEWNNKTRDEYLEYLGERIREISEKQDENVRRIDLEELYITNDRMLKSEQVTYEKRRRMERVEEQLKCEPIIGLMDFLANPPADCTEDSYLKKANELSGLFAKLMDFYYDRGQRL